MAKTHVVAEYPQAIAIRLPSGLLEQAKELAQNKQVSLSGLIRDLLEREIAVSRPELRKVFSQNGVDVFVAAKPNL